MREAQRGEAIARAAETPHILLNAPLIGQRLGYPDLSGLDLLELFAFVHPARFAVPTVAGLSRALGLEPPPSEAEAAASLPVMAAAVAGRRSRTRTGRSAKGRGPRTRRWPGSAGAGRRSISARLDPPESGERMLFSRLAQWEEAADRPPPRTVAIDPDAAQARLDRADRGRVRAARGAAGDGRRGDVGVCPQARRGRAQHAARRSRHRHRQDARLSRAGVAVGRRRRAGRCGCRPSPRRCNASSTPRGASCSPTRPNARRESSSARAARIICACSIWRTRCRARSPGARRSSRISSAAGRRTRAMATWSAATFPAGCRACSGGRERPR